METPTFLHALAAEADDRGAVVKDKTLQLGSKPFDLDNGDLVGTNSPVGRREEQGSRSIPDLNTIRSKPFATNKVKARTAVDDPLAWVR